MDKNYQVSLLFNANKAYDRQVMEGIGDYLHANQCCWNIYIEEDFTTSIEQFKSWKGDGVIADFDNPALEQLMMEADMPVVGVGGSYANPDHYPKVPYVATDNKQLVVMAFEHLKSKGLEQFAFYGIPQDSWERWAIERENTFIELMENESYEYSIFHGSSTNSKTWQEDMNNLESWLKGLPIPVGIIAVTDARARHILQVCDQLKILVPEQVAVIGIDNEEMTRYLTRVSLSSVAQGTRRMGYQAAKLLHNLLNKTPNRSGQLPRILVPPTKVRQRQSSDYQGVDDPYVANALHYIRHHACKGIKVEQVLDYIGISRTNLEGRFKSLRQHSIHQEIHQAKLERAAQLLRESELPIADISEACGYPSIQYLYSVFKKHYSQTPKEYRVYYQTQKNV